MSEKNIEMMKKIIEAKKEKGSQKGSLGRPDRTIGQGQNAKRKVNGGGLFDK
jgi:hypothetical protein